jgi:hypothetical protein
MLFLQGDLKTEGFSNFDENTPGVLIRVTVTKTLPAGRQGLRLGASGYGNLLKRTTLPKGDTGIVSVTLRRDIYFLINLQCYERAGPDPVSNDRACKIEDRCGPIDNGRVARGDNSTEFKENLLRNVDCQGFSRKSFLL